MAAPLNVASHLARMAHDHPAQVAIYSPRGHVKPEGITDHRAITFDELNADADAIAHGLHGAGVARGTRTALMVPPSPDFFALTFALFKVGAVPVLIDPGMGIRNLGKCLAEAEPAAFVGIAKAHAARRVLGWAKKSVRTTVNAGWWRFLCDTSLSRLRKAGKRRARTTSRSRNRPSRRRSCSPAAAPASRRAWCTRTASSRRRWRC